MWATMRFAVVKCIRLTAVLMREMWENRPPPGRRNIYGR
jgi:hypothetical protein